MADDFDFINEWDEFDDPEEFADGGDEWTDPAFISERQVNGMFYNNYL